MIYSRIAILRKIDRTMLRVICKVKLMDRKTTSELMTMLGLTAQMKKFAESLFKRRFFQPHQVKEMCLNI